MPASESAEPQKARRMRPRSSVVLFLAYALGPFAPVVLRQGRGNLTWTLLTLLCVLTWGGMAWRWTAVRAAVTPGTVALVPWVLGVAAATGVWVLSAARGGWPPSRRRPPGAVHRAYPESRRAESGTANLRTVRFP